MNARRVHAVIAAGLENPELLALWQREPELLRNSGVDPDKLDLGALWKFAGLTAKVRHNGLRADLPFTFRLLNVAGLEIDVFASYASFRASEGGRYADTTEARTQDLLIFLEHWLEPDRREHVLLWDLIRHELALTRLSRESQRPLAPAAARQVMSTTPRATSVPRLCGDVILHEMRSDPRVVGMALRDKAPRLDGVQLGTFHFCYWRKSGGAEINIIQLDELGYYLLSLSDGKRSAADLSRLTGGSGRPARGFLRALGELSVFGILALDATHEAR
jgi:hypothetical protein